MPQKIRVIIFLPCFGIGGTERVVLDLCRHLSRTRFEVEVCTMAGGVFADQVAASGIPVHLLAPPVTLQRGLPQKIRNYVRMLSSLRALIRRGSPTVLHTHHYAPLLQGCFIRKGGARHFGWLHTEHSVTDVKNAYSSIMFRALNPMASPDLINGVAEKVTSCMREVSGMPAGRAVTVLNGIETARFATGTGAEKRRELGFAEDDVLIGTVGMLRQEKNQQLLIKAFASMAAQFPKSHCIICGEGVCRPELEKLAADLRIAERVKFLGYRTDSHEIMKCLDIYCLPSVYEGLPLSILEAWAAGKPVIATRVMGNVDIIEDGVNGLLVPLHDDSMMAEALKRLMQDRVLAVRLAAKGHAVATHRFDVGTMVARYEDLYVQLARR